ncbi:MAG: hypothetical protein QXD72_02575, partial [Candidatus Aenigmatarchaeota archaeon]
MAFPIENFLSPNLTNMLITFVIPFLIIFTVLLAALKRTRILGDNLFIYVIISLGLTTMIYAINPNNIFVTEEYGLKLLDFGYSLTEDEAVKVPEDNIIGTFPYLSPEQMGF